ncbi:MAG TPA: hypothetical protein DCM73_02500 [Clostridiales bacterium]|nr:hypothetical protein [Clostridiales bacterium]
MSFEKIFEDINFNFQTNRVLSFGDVAFKREEIYEAAEKKHDFGSWYTEWRNIAETAEKDGYLPCLAIGENPLNKTVLIHGGYDSFIEEFYIVSEWLAKSGYNVILFEVEGKGGILRQGMKFNEKWENSVGVVLDYFKLDKETLIGISWGGYFALRAADYICNYVKLKK